MDDNARFGTFEQAAGEVVRWLEREPGADGWLLARRQAEEWSVMASADPVCGLQRGDVVVWRDAVREKLVDSSEPAVVEADGEHLGRRVRPEPTALAMGALITVPLVGDDGRVTGALMGTRRDASREKGALDPGRLALLAGLLGRLLHHEIESVELARRNERFRYEAMTDALTHLPNRRAWEEKLAAEQQRSRRLGEMTFVTVVDLDNLKETNDREGHAAGDRLLRQAALTLRYAVRDRDFVARIGGDEFAVLGMQCGPVDADEISGRIREALERADVRASVGTAASDPAHGHDEIWRNADSVMYRNKKAQRNGVSG
jgi:diguanylate cyclase (GGDEF)-like protein